MKGKGHEDEKLARALDASRKKAKRMVKLGSGLSVAEEEASRRFEHSRKPVNRVCLLYTSPSPRDS